MNGPASIDPLFSRFATASEREFYRRVWYLAGAVLALGVEEEATEALADVVDRAAARQRCGRGRAASG